MKTRFIFKSEKKDILKLLEHYGITELPYLLVASGKEKIRGYSGILSTDELIAIDEAVGIELIGAYFFHYYKDNLRLAPDAIHLLKDKITKNIIEISEEQARDWFRGQDILLKKENQEKFKLESKTFKIIKFKGDLIGSGKLTEDRIVNYTPKERRLRN
jgi:NOL1/NOP2/fmu family ribosome biogenesis protein